MKDRTIIFLIGLGIGFFVCSFFYPILFPSPLATPLNNSAYALFSPGVQKEYLAVLNSAQKSVDVELYEFSNTALENALISLEQKGVRVRVILESEVDQNWFTAKILKENGVEVRIASKKFKRTHSKFAVVDGKEVLVGSTNWSYSALNLNREASLLVNSRSLAQQFENIFNSDWNIAEEMKNV